MPFYPFPTQIALFLLMHLTQNLLEERRGEAKLTNSLPFAREALLKLTTFYDSQTFQVCLGKEKIEIEEKLFQ